MCPRTTILHVSSYYYICVLVIQDMCPHTPTQHVQAPHLRLRHVCPRNAICVPSCYYVCVLVLLYMCPRTTTCVLILLHNICEHPQTTCVLVLLYMCPRTTICVLPRTTTCVSSYSYYTHVFILLHNRTTRLTGKKKNRQMPSQTGGGGCHAVGGGLPVLLLRSLLLTCCTLSCCQYNIRRYIHTYIHIFTYLLVEL